MMEWTEVDVNTTSEAVEAVSSILTDLGAAGIKIDDANDVLNYERADKSVYINWDEVDHRLEGAVVTAYYPVSIFVPEILPIIEHKVSQLGEFGLDYLPGTVTMAAVENTEWATAWKKYYHAVRLTNRLTIVPSWEEYTPVQPQEKLIVLDPGMAFGTGTHPTTRVMLEALEMVVRGGESMLDVGTGSGVLSIAAKHLGVGDIHATDIDEIAVRKAQENLDLNPVGKDIKITASDLLKDVAETDVDLIVANILSEVLHPLIPQAWEKLRAGGLFLTSGIIDEKFNEIKTAEETMGFVIDQTLKIGDWFGIIAHKPAPDEVNEFTAQG